MTIPDDTHPDDDDDAHSLSTEYAELPSHKLLAKLQKQRLQANPRRKTVEKRGKKKEKTTTGSLVPYRCRELPARPAQLELGMRSHLSSFVESLLPPRT
jgi:hypothetical protein